MVPVGTMSRAEAPQLSHIQPAPIPELSDDVPEDDPERSSCFGLTLDADSSRPSLGRGGASTRLPTRRNSHCRDVTGPSEALVRLS